MKAPLERNCPNALTYAAVPECSMGTDLGPDLCDRKGKKNLVVASGCSEQTRSRKAEQAVACHYDVVVQRKVESSSRFHQLPGNRAILGRRSGISTRVVVHHDDPDGCLSDGGAEHLAGMHQRAVEQPASHQHIAQHLALTVERQQMERGSGSFVIPRSLQKSRKGEGQVGRGSRHYHPPKDGHVPSLARDTIADSYTPSAETPDRSSRLIGRRPARTLHTRARAWARGHGHGLSRPRPQARPYGRPQGASPGTGSPAWP